MVHGLRALGDTMTQDKQLTLENVTIAVVGKDVPFYQLEGDACKVITLMIRFLICIVRSTWI